MLGVPGPARLMGPHGDGLRGGRRSPTYQRIQQCTVRSNQGQICQIAKCCLNWASVVKFNEDWRLERHRRCTKIVLGAPDTWGPWAGAHRACWTALSSNLVDKIFTGCAARLRKQRLLVSHNITALAWTRGAGGPGPLNGRAKMF